MKHSILKPKDLCEIPSDVVRALRADGWWLRSRLPWLKRNSMPGSEKDRPSGSGSTVEYVFLLTKSAKYFYDNEAVKVPAHDWGMRDRSNFRGGTKDPKLKHHGLKNCNHAESGRERRPSDWFFESWQGLYEEDGEPLAFVVNPQSFKGAHFACVDEKTECLTVSGWKHYKELNVGDIIAAYDLDKKLCKWTPLQQIFGYPIANQRMIRILGRGIDQLLTPNHRCVIRRRSEKDVIVEADNLKSSHRMLIASKWVSLNKIKFPCRLAAILGWYVTEGSVGKDCVTIYQSSSANPQYCKEIDQLLSDEGAEYTRYERKGLYKKKEILSVSWRITGGLANILLSLSPHKRLPKGFLNWDNDSLWALWDSLMKGDGHFREGNRSTFVQKDKKLIDQVQALAFRLGFSTTLRMRSAKTWALYKTESKTRCLHTQTQKIIWNEYYTGQIWCPKTKYGTFVGRRNGRVFITGNTFPEKLVEPCIKAGTSEKGCCPECGEPWVRVMEKGELKPTSVRGLQAHNPEIHKKDETGYERKTAINDSIHPGCAYQLKTIGWKPGCSCLSDDPLDGRDGPRAPFISIPCTTLDPFFGSGTVAVVSERLRRDWVGIELSTDYCKLSKNRVKESIKQRRLF